MNISPLPAEKGSSAKKSKPLSISRRLTVSLVLTITIVATTTIVTIYMHASQRQQRELNAKADEHLSYLIGTLELPLWNVDSRTVQVIGETVSRNELIVRLLIKGPRGNIFYELESERSLELIDRSGKIFHQDKFIGEVELSLTRKFYQKANRNLLLFYGISFLIVIFALIFVTGFLVRKFLKTPLQSLNEIVDAYADGVYNATASRLPYLEFKSFGSVLSQMGDKIQAQMNELKQTMGALRRAHNEMETKVTERTAELLEAKERAESANRAKSVFLSTMSHELRTPLNAILGFAQLICRSSSVPTEHKEQLEMINRSGEHLLALINHVLDMSKIEAGRATVEEHPFDLGNLIDEVEQSFRSRAVNKGLEFYIDVASTVPRYVIADEIKLRQILINLLGNAVKYTVRGIIELKAYLKTELDTEHTIADDTEGQSPISRLCFDVKDSGPGIGEDELEDVFEAFVQTTKGQQQQEGTGLGLTLSKQFAELMGGQLTIESTVGKGSVFNFEIPIQITTSDQVQPRKKLPKVVGLELNQPRYRILVVDDVESSRRLVADTLTGVSSTNKSEPGFDVQTACNGREALEVWQTWHPHLIWMDIRMPVMDGYETTRLIKATAQGRTTAVIALSASAFEEQRSAVLGAGCDDFMRKPFQLYDFFDMMNKHIGVRYVYEKEGLHDETSVETPVQMTIIAESLSNIDDAILKDLHNAAKETNPLKTQTVINLIAEQDQILASELSKLASSFRFDVLCNILEANK